MTVPALPADVDEQAASRLLAALPAAVGITIPADVDEAWERVVDEANRITRATVRLGAYLTWLRTRLSAQAFAAGIERHDIAPAQATAAMRIARLLLHAETPQRARLLDLKDSQLAQLARLDPDELAEACEQGELDLDDVASMSARMLREEVRRLRIAKSALGARLADERIRHKQREMEVSALSPTAGLPASIVRLRGEAAGFAEAARLDLAALARLADGLRDAPDLGARRPERARHLRDGARVLMLHAAAVLTEAADAYETLRGTLEAWLPADGAWTAEDQPDPLTLAEARQVRRWRDTHAQRLDRDAAGREAERLARGEVRRGRGRPRKVTASGAR